MSQDAERRRMLQFLDEHIFDPVLRTSPDRVDRREAFEDAQTRTGRLKARCHACASADELLRLCVELTTSTEGKQAERELDRLGLPTFARLGKHFLTLCEQLGVGSHDGVHAQS